ncbi:conserved exported hypothetical protein [Flavobacterium psychrophilum]|uniref:T9SS type B sorting domain-containing protein n=1 Tax=Flavobacterium psychrophilum TaxID=96345 RepID=UPI000B7C0D12|nr:T9SS type B sorting domain-containing protein [Flavobacterium psychrophilum]SNB17097.1 conserved exported hypothetical protein [Flavobacterium psychrophilum]
MKKVILLSFLLFSVVGFSQVITVNTSTYTIDGLVKTVLTNNSPCLSINNVSSRTGTNFGSTNGIGYFTNTNPAFPLQNGVILTTGNVMNAPGPNNTVLSDGTLAWAGDSDLEMALALAGITIVSKNATVLEFDFKPLSPNFNFNFLFASEEYGNYQCFSPDAFAFLLKNNTTGVTKNLAVIPSTTIPISVQTIRNSIYNPSCSSNNSNYFGLFNDGTAATAAATNYNGQTVVMNAYATNLSTTDTYHIKLVIADGVNDNKIDSAVFLGGGSFDFGQDVLGPDLTIANGTAPCNNNNTNQPYTIYSGLDPNLFDFVWKDINGIPIPGETDPNLTINESGTYLLTYYVQSTSCEVATNNIAIEYNIPISTPDPINLYKCNNGSANYTFDLATNTPIVGLGSNYLISYYALQNEANAGNTSPLPTSYTVASASLPKTIWIRIQNLTTGCYYSKSFILELTPSPIANFPANMLECETISGSGRADFYLGNIAQTNTVLGAQSSSIYGISYHLTATDAASGANPINTAIAFNSGNATIYIAVYVKTEPSCSSIINFNLIVNTKPIIEDKPDQFVCTSYYLPALTPALGNYYSGINGTGTLYAIGHQVSISQLIYIYYQNPTTGCNAQTDFQVTIVKEQDLTPGNVTACDSYPLPNYPYLGTRYFTNAGGPINGNTEMFQPPTGMPITSLGVTTIHVYYQSPTDPTCIIFTSFTVTISKTPTITGSYPNLFDCTVVNSLQPISTDIGTAKYYTLAIPTGIYTPVVLPITTNTTVYLFAENNNCKTPILNFSVVIGTDSFLDNTDSCGPYNLAAPLVGEYRTQANGGGTIITPRLINTTATIFHYVAGAPCTYNYSFTIRIIKPTLTAPAPETRCNLYTLPVNLEGGTYYTLSGGPTTPLNTQLAVGHIITNTTTLYIYKESTTALLPICYNEQPWTITINQKPALAPIATEYTVCYDFTIINQPPVGNYYHKPHNPLIPETPIALPYTIFQENTPSNLETIYIYAENPNDASCNSETSFIIKFDGVAITNEMKKDRYACDTYTLPTLPTNFYYYTATGGPHGTGSIVTQQTYTTSTSAPIFIYTETNVHQICSDETSFNIIINKTPTAYPVNVIEKCDTFKLNDGIFEFDLTQSETEVLGTQTPTTDYSITYYTSLAEANNPNAIPIPNSTTYKNNNPNNDSVWIRVSKNNNIPITSCFAITELKLKVDLLPNPQLNPEYFICKDHKTGTLLNFVTLNTELSNPNYTYTWTLDNAPYAANTSVITTNKVGAYSVTVTDTSTILNCPKTITTKITLYEPYITFDYSDAFENSTYITVNVLGAGSGNYEYQLDNGLYQSSNIFYNIYPGEHTISARDKNEHCAPSPVKAIIINYPKFFTPNGDGYNETWNIPNLKITNPNAMIFIFDRFGKLIKQMTPTSDGWNGTYNEQPLPATDYWFTINYNEKETSKIFKSHFTLKR